MTDVQYISDANGKQVGVIVPIEVWEEIESDKLTNRINELKRLFKRTQSLPSVRALTDDDISKEIDDCRNGK
ncbi:MAG: hypothetical protein HS105_00720 [Chloracidobacterium sp.]|nr:hypothetical protein [Chloracidobacterium sp.]MCO5332533.1 hypothetical protein [Pyrinomonadaceae bacterium]